MPDTKSTMMWCLY